MTEIRPAATVLILKTHPEDGIQVLLLKRNNKLVFAPDFWVFPGGRIDPSDGPSDSEHLEHTARMAALREAKEESNLNLEVEKLYHFCHWTTPSGGSRRFGTWFFHTLIEDESSKVIIDQSEIVDYKWLHPMTALELLKNKKIDLLPPTFITLNRIREARSYEAVRTEFERTGVVYAAPVTQLHNGRFYCLYKGDSGYNTGSIEVGHQQHRLIIDSENRGYHFTYQNCDEYPPVNGGVPLL